VSWHTLSAQHCWETWATLTPTPQPTSDVGGVEHSLLLLAPQFHNGRCEGLMWYIQVTQGTYYHPPTHPTEGIWPLRAHPVRPGHRKIGTGGGWWRGWRGRGGWGWGGLWGRDRGWWPGGEGLVEGPAVLSGFSGKAMRCTGHCNRHKQQQTAAARPAS